MGAATQFAAQLAFVAAISYNGANQIIAIGDSGAYPRCFRGLFPYNRISTTGVFRAYWTQLGDSSDNEGHGSHLASLAMQIAPMAQLVMVDLERGADGFDIPDSSSDQFQREYFGLMYSTGARIACNAWNYPPESAASVTVRQAIDDFVSAHPDFLPVFSSGNVQMTERHAVQPRWAPCDALNVLCVGASYQSADVYLHNPPLAFLVVQLPRMTLPVVAAFFGSTRPRIRYGSSSCTSTTLVDCLHSGHACHLCVLERKVLGSASGELLAVGTACSLVTSDVRMKICLVKRGECSFVVKARNCAQGGAIGVLITSNILTVMTDDGDEDDITIPVALIVADYDAFVGGLSAGSHAQFPILDPRIQGHGITLYSRTCDILVTGDQLTACAHGNGEPETCSGTSQATALAAAMTAQLRGFLQSLLADPAGHTIRALVACAAHPSKGATFGVLVSIGVTTYPVAVMQEIARTPESVVSYCYTLSTESAIAVGFTVPAGTKRSLLEVIFFDESATNEVELPHSAHTLTVILLRTAAVSRVRVRVRMRASVPYAVVAVNGTRVACTAGCVNGDSLAKTDPRRIEQHLRCVCNGEFVGQWCAVKYQDLSHGEWNIIAGDFWLYFRVAALAHREKLRLRLNTTVQVDASIVGSSPFGGPERALRVKWIENDVAFEWRESLLEIRFGAVENIYIALRSPEKVVPVQMTLEDICAETHTPVSTTHPSSCFDELTMILICCCGFIMAGILLVLCVRRRSVSGIVRVAPQHEDNVSLAVDGMSIASLSRAATESHGGKSASSDSELAQTWPTSRTKRLVLDTSEQKSTSRSSSAPSHTQTTQCTEMELLTRKWTDKRAKNRRPPRAISTSTTRDTLPESLAQNWAAERLAFTIGSPSPKSRSRRYVVGSSLSQTWSADRMSTVLENRNGRMDLRVSARGREFLERTL